MEWERKVNSTPKGRKEVWKLIRKNERNDDERDGERYVECGSEKVISGSMCEDDQHTGRALRFFSKRGGRTARGSDVDKENKQGKEDAFDKERKDGKCSNAVQRRHSGRMLPWFATEPRTHDTVRKRNDGRVLHRMPKAGRQERVRRARQWNDHGSHASVHGRSRVQRPQRSRSDTIRKGDAKVEAKPRTSDGVCDKNKSSIWRATLCDAREQARSPEEGSELDIGHG